MDTLFDFDKAKSVVEGGIAQATDLLSQPSKIDELLKSAEESLRSVPLAGDLLADVPLMVALIKSYINKTYTNVSVKVIATMVSALLYLIKKNDIIPDNIPVIGRADDLAVLGFALKFCEPELKAFKAWRDGATV